MVVVGLPDFVDEPVSVALVIAGPKHYILALQMLSIFYKHHRVDNFEFKHMLSCI